MHAELAANKGFQDSEGQGLDPLKIQKIALTIFAKAIPFFVLTFLVIFTVLAFFFWKQTTSRPDRYAAYASLIYNPKSAEKYRALDGRLVTDLFLRSNLRHNVAAKLGMTAMEEGALGSLINVSQVKNRTNLILVTCNGSTAEKAVLLNRAVVSVGIEEFIKFRSNELNERLDYLQRQRESGLRELSEYELEMRKLLDPLSLATPEQQLTKLRHTISGQLMTVSELNIKISSLQQKIDEINVLLEGIDPNIQDHLNTLAYYASEEERLNRELLRSRQLYTDENPKVKAAQAELELIREQKEKFAKEKNLAEHDPDITRRLRQLKDNQRIFANDMTQLTQQHEIAIQELEQNKKRSENLLVFLAEENKLNNKISSARNMLRNFDSDIPALKTLLASVPQELLVLEGAESAVLTDKSLLKKMVVALFLAGIVVFNMALAWVSTLYFTGNIESLNEVTLLTSIDCLGGFPNLSTKNSDYDDEHLMEIATDLFFKLKDYLQEGQTLFEASFRGAGGEEKFRELLNINFAMNGMRHFNLVCDTFVDTPQSARQRNIDCNRADWEDELLAVEKVNARLGYFNLSSPYLLLASEIEILTRDIDLLKKHYDVIVISCNNVFSGGELAFRQLTDFADCTLIIFGFQKTPRRILRHLARIKNSLSGQLCCLLTGIKNDAWS